MNRILLPILALLSTAVITGCTTKVYNQPPAASSNPTIIEHDRPIVSERVVEPSSVAPAEPKVQNNIHVDR